ncbi:MAG: IPT/TIG domain-containing protein, partial [Candidatus Sericytochromatia bacterium]|nr:IPT/TIG domain-containing protein [Candidatus Tanganyikabacteria bacterium]
MGSPPPGPRRRLGAWIAPSAWRTVRACAWEGNKRNAVSLGPIPALIPVITGFSPKAGGPGTTLSISGSNFGDAQNPFSLKLGGIAISQAYLDNGTIYATLPSNATTSLFVVSVDGVASDSIQLFTPVASLDL